MGCCVDSSDSVDDSAVVSGKSGMTVDAISLQLSLMLFMTSEMSFMVSMLGAAAAIIGDVGRDDGGVTSAIS